jgi:uncharacterized protein YqeY
VIVEDLQSRLRADLKAAMRSADQPAITAVRSLMSALANAEAVPIPTGPYTVVGGSADVARRDLTAEEIARIVAIEIEDHRRAIAEYESIGADAARLCEELVILERYL